VPRYLAETYMPRARAADAAAARRRARSAARELSRQGTIVRHVRTTLLPEDETCFHVFVAESHEDVADACRRAGLGSPRIVPVLE
jgi:hypothetical protein